jgi:hypothetical protein
MKERQGHGTRTNWILLVAVGFWGYPFLAGRLFP